MRTNDISDFRRLREQAELTIAETAVLLDKSERQIRRYDLGEQKAPLPDMRVLKVEADMKPQLPLKPAADFRFIDLFAGIGGLRIGFEGIGGKCVFTSEWDKFSQQTYRANFQDGDDHVFAGDIRPYGADPSLIPEHDVLLAGFPCQPFSIAGVSKKNALGRPHGFSDETQGTLFFDIQKIIAYHRPKAFLLENVKNLQRHDKGNTFKVISSVLEKELGYRIQHRVIASNPWVPQKRERIFIVGFRDDTDFDFSQFDALIPPQNEWPVLGDILQGHNEIDSKYTLTPRLWEYLQAYKEKHAGQGNGFGFGLCGPDDVTRTLSARYYKDGSEILVKQRGRQRPRRLTPTECARLMGFEYDAKGRSWRIPVSDTQAYRQFGNAVVVPVIEAIAELMEPHIKKALTVEEKVAAVA
ncbi:DNA (cytosine-5-)-methyltransferase [Parvularcula flava]|uniref:Cytosine-specific methyltransferase n=1 Tax=Aquisalinus luteolus TaxID=1566827 RepID=A0A8J3EQR8_9PROT|nr:DNA (cytosine-5-)-methyltransferase [Aquisalinus luteolus]NHK27773.1 DNA (cytosine-5-)-methyltransferase [Aquisalinus luteolus]GGH96456.1 cytosine-specific methyltransferase [Aquisalinus luteolus]